MPNTPDLRILFPTSFSDSCFRTARAIAQLADTCRISLTITHVAKPGEGNTSLRRELDSFLAEADHYDSCRRLLVESDDAIQSIAELCEWEPYDLVVVPASDRLGLHSLITPSFRAKLLKHCKTPVWTAGRCLEYANFKTNIQTVACLVDFESQSATYLPLVEAFASRFGARLRVVSVLPEVTEATLARSFASDAPLLPEVAMERIRKAFAGRPCPDIDIAIGEVARELPRLLRRCNADLAFLGPGQVLRGTWLPWRLRYLNRLPCPAVCVDGASAAFGQWNFQNHAAPESVFEKFMPVPSESALVTAPWRGSFAKADYVSGFASRN